jgi:hypothetical protein
MGVHARILKPYCRKCHAAIGIKTVKKSGQFSRGSIS